MENNFYHIRRAPLSVTILRTYVYCIMRATPMLLYSVNIIQLTHSFEVDIRICQPENSDVHRGKAEVNITFEG